MKFSKNENFIRICFAIAIFFIVYLSKVFEILNFGWRLAVFVLLGFYIPIIFVFILRLVESKS